MERKPELSAYFLIFTKKKYLEENLFFKDFCYLSKIIKSCGGESFTKFHAPGKGSSM